MRPLGIKGMFSWFRAAGLSRATGLAARLGAALAIFLAAAASVGWILRIPGLVTGWVDWAPIRPLTILAILAAGLSLWMQAGPESSALARRWGRAIALVPLAIGALTTVEYTTGLDLGIDRVGLPDWHWALAMPLPGRPAPETAAALVLLGSGLAVLDFRSSLVKVRPAEILVGAAGYVAFLATLTFLLPNHQVFRISALNAMAVPTAIAMMALSAGALLARPDIGLAALVTSPGVDGVLVRRLLPPALLFPALAGYGYIASIDLGRTGQALTVASLVLVTAAGLACLLVMNAVAAGQRERALENAKAAAAHLSDFVESSDDAIYGVGLDGVITSWNGGAERLYGYPAEEAVGRHVSILVPPDLEDEVPRLLSVIARGERVEHFETRRMCRAGRAVFVSLGLSPVYREGRVVAASAIARDIRDRVRAEEALKASEERFRTIFDAAADGFLIIGAGGMILQANRAAESIFGYDPSSLAGQDYTVLVPEAIREGHHRQHARFFDAPRARLMGQGKDLMAQRRDRTLFAADISMGPMTVRGETMVVAGIRDVTRQRALMEALAKQRAERQQATRLAAIKEHLLSSFSHEMQTPLAEILGYGELLKDANPGDPLLDGLLKGAARMAAHVKNVVDVSAILGGVLPLCKDQIDVAEVVEATIRGIEPAYRQKGVALSFRVEPETPTIEADGARVSQVVFELLDNARKFTDPGGQAEVAVARAGSEVCIEVSDTGRGIPDPDQQRIWEALYQLDLGDALRQGGLGLGLTLARGLTDLHGGRITLQSRPGEGSSFRVFLPISNGGERSPDKPGPDSFSLGYDVEGSGFQPATSGD